MDSETDIWVCSSKCPASSSNLYKLNNFEITAKFKSYDNITIEFEVVERPWNRVATTIMSACN
jgi:hypothetical protein